jgi:endonuclease YncB( thermonuclease family)
VVDADTIYAEIDLGWRMELHEAVRVEGIDAWEIRGAERPQGLIAKAFVEELLPVGSSATLVGSGGRGKYGRVLGRIKLPDCQDLGEVLIALGHAEPY